MAGLYIKGIEMPKDKWGYTEIQIWGDGLITTREGKMLTWGKYAIEVPDHGDLIEKPILIDELAISEEPDDCSSCASYNSYDDFCCRSLDFQNMCRSIRTAPVVIPAKKEGV